MAKILEMPKLSPTMEEGVLATWHKKEGDTVNVDDVLAEVETDKATMEFRSFDKGTLLKLLVVAGSNVKLGQPLAILGAAGEDVSALEAQATQAMGGAPPQAAPPAEPPGERKRERKDEGAAWEGAPEEPTTSSAAPPAATPNDPRQATAASAQRPAVRPPSPPSADPRTGSASRLDRTAHAPAPPSAVPRGDDNHEASSQPERVMASPYVRKSAREMGVDLQGAQGSGPGGRVVASDLEGLKRSRVATAALATAPTPAAQPMALTTLGLAEPESRPLSRMRKTIARRLTESKQSVPHFYLTIDVDAGELTRFRGSINEDLAASRPPSKKDDPNQTAAKVSLNDLLIKACATALVRVPECNAQFSPEALLIHRRVDISVAVAVPEGLVTPVVRNADQKSVVAIAREVRELASRARARKLSPEEMMNGTFSISNLGMFGIDAFSAVINPPEGAILAVGQVRDEAVVHDGAVVAGKKLALTLSCDHRVIDGAIGAAFLAELRALIEHPMRILTG